MYKNNCCVYILKDPRDNTCAYVGHTTQPIRRKRDHNYATRYVFIVLLWCESTRDAMEYERILIAKLKMWGQAKRNKNSKALTPRGKRYTDEVNKRHLIIQSPIQ